MILLFLCLSLDFFFFQAEDGIRDGHVTGVQTCALPISPRSRRAGPGSPRRRTRPPAPAATGCPGRTGVPRSEERRVGKECSSGWSPDHYEEIMQSGVNEEKLYLIVADLVGLVLTT